MLKKSLYVVLIIVPVFIILLSIIYHSEPMVISARIFAVFYRIKSAYLYITSSIDDVRQYFRSNISLIEENKRLKEESRQLKVQNNLLEYCTNENRELKRFLGYRYENNYRLLLVKVVEYIRSYSKDVVIVNAGEREGIKKGMYAVTDLGMAGKVIETSNTFSYVRLLSDRRSLFAVVSVNNRTKGIIQGEGRYNNRLTMRYIPMSSNVEVDDIVVTTESLETYSMAGIPIGVIKDVRQFSLEMFQEAYIMSFVDFGKIEYLYIIIM